MAMSLIPTAAALLAVSAEPAGRTHVLAALAGVSGRAQAGSGGRIAAGTVRTLWTYLLAAWTPATLGTSLGAVVSRPAGQAAALPRAPVAGRSPAGAGLAAPGPEPPLRTLLLAVLPMVAFGTVLQALPGNMITRYFW